MTHPKLSTVRAGEVQVGDIVHSAGASRVSPWEVLRVVARGSVVRLYWSTTDGDCYVQVKRDDEVRIQVCP